MKVRTLVFLSVLLNVALIVLAWRRGPRPTMSSSGAVTQTVPALPTMRLRTNLTRVEVTETNEPAPFHWRQVQSEDLREFTANLRGIGCPPETIRTIIEGELWARFLPRRRALLEPFHQRYWDLAAVGPDTEKAVEPVRESVEKLKKETIETLDALVGPAPATEERFARRQGLDFLPEAKQRAMEDLEKNFSEAIGKVHPERGGKMTPELQANREELQAQRQAAIRALMTPEEHSEFELQQSRFTHIAQSPVGFDATPDDMRAITRIYQRYEAADARLDLKDPNAATKKIQKEEAMKQREEALKEALGSPERYTQFQEGSDNRFQEVYQITQRYELPRETASEAARVLKSSEEAMRQLRQAKTLDKQELLQRRVSVQLETRGALLGVLGERALLTYEKYHGPIVPPITDIDQE